MGIDALIYVSDDGISDETIEVLNRYLGETPLRRVPGWIVHGTWQRLFSHGYARGYWPTIKSQIRWMQKSFPDRPVFYHGDVSDFGTADPFREVDMARLDELWNAWYAEEEEVATDFIRLENTDLWLKCHPAGTCMGQVCSLHARTEHHMRGWPQHWRGDRYLMERTCEHGVGHPDPDDYMVLTGKDSGVHGCDGCCHE